MNEGSLYSRVRRGVKGLFAYAQINETKRNENKDSFYFKSLTKGTRCVTILLDIYLLRFYDSRVPAYCLFCLSSLITYALRDSSKTSGQILASTTLDLAQLDDSASMPNESTSLSNSRNFF